jgi:hypothetical protein
MNKIQDDAWIVRVFDFTQVVAKRDNVIIVEELTLSGSYRVEWEVVHDDVWEVTARRLKRPWERLESKI